MRRWFSFAKSRPRTTTPRELFAVYRGFLSAPPAEGRWSNKRLFTLMWACGLTSMLSVVIGDAQANAPCVEACKTDGWSNGRLRGDPHAAPGGSYTYECWCYRGSEWSEAPIDPARLGR